MGVNGINGFGSTGAPYGYDRFKDAPLVPGASEEEWEEQAGVEGVEGEEDAEKAEDQVGKKPGRKSSPAECETCKNRKYQDGSDENNVSFKAAAHISPTAAGAAVRAHEQEHVDNAYKKAKEGGGKVLQASVAIHTSICPECGRTYVSGGTTHTMIKYNNEKNPYTQEKKANDALGLRGQNIDLAV